MNYPAAGTNPPGYPAMQPTDSGGAPVAVSPAPASDWRDRLGAFFATLLAALALAGCGVPASRVCYLATEATVRAVDIGMTVAGDLYRQGKLPEETKAKLVATHDTYRPLAKAAVEGCKVLNTSDEAGAQRQAKAIQLAAEPVISALAAAGAK